MCQVLLQELSSEAGIGPGEEASLQEGGVISWVMLLDGGLRSARWKSLGTLMGGSGGWGGPKPGWNWVKGEREDREWRWHVWTTPSHGGMEKGGGDWGQERVS